MRLKKIHQGEITPYKYLAEIYADNHERK